jgi:hypothetical protein
MSTASILGRVVVGGAVAVLTAFSHAGCGAWNHFPGDAWEIGIAAVSTGGGGIGASCAEAGDGCSCKFIHLWCCFKLLGRKLLTITWKQWFTLENKENMGAIKEANS